MFDAGYFLLAIAALLPVIASGIIFSLDRAFGDRLSYWGRQAVIGIIFGALAIVGTEWGIHIGGFVVNCRDAAVLCAGLLFGGPAGIIAGLIGGIERLVAVAWGAGTYTLVTCTVSTILAGFYAAGIRRFVLEGERPSWAFAFVAGLVMESFHSSMIFITHVDAMQEAFDVMLVCAPPMLVLNSLSVMLATIVVSFISKGSFKRTPVSEKSIINTLQSRLLTAIVITGLLLIPLQYAIETAVAYTSNEQLLSQTLNNARQLDVPEASGETSSENAGEVSYYSVGDTGFLLISDMASGRIVSGPGALLGKTLSDVGLSNVDDPQHAGISEGAAVRSAMYEACVAGTDCLCMDQRNGDYLLTVAYPVDEAYQNRDRAMILSTLVQIMLFAVVFVLAFFFMKRHVVAPVHRVNDALEQITAGNLDEEVNERSALEFAELSDGINTTVNALQRYTREAEKRMAQELELARTIQYSALPSQFPPYPDRTEFDIFARMDTAKEVGGDFYDFFFTRHSTLDFIIADVSGKGIPAALFMMNAKSKIEGLADSGLPVEDVFSQANDNLSAENESCVFVTAWLGSLDLASGVVSFANAGHNPPVVRHGAGDFEFVDCKPNIVLAACPDIDYMRQELKLEPGDVIFLYTDGVTEARNPEHALYGEDRLLTCMNNARFSTMEELCAQVKAGVDDFAQGAEQADDITMLALWYKGPQSATGPTAARYGTAIR